MILALLADMELSDGGKNRKPYNRYEKITRSLQPKPTNRSSSESTPTRSGFTSPGNLTGATLQTGAENGL